jgi:transposase
MRGLFRMRGLFVRMRTALKCNVHGQLFRQGVLLEEESSIFTLKARAALKRIDMDESERSELARKFALLADLDIHIKDVERVIKLDLPAHRAGPTSGDEAPGKDNDDARIVDSLPGFGVILSHGILSEMGELARFPNGRALAAYAGVLPLDNESADKDLGKHTGSPGKARVAVARELAELAHLLLSRRVLFTETPPPRPGSPKAVAAAKKLLRGERASPQLAKTRARKRKRRSTATSKG